MNLSVSLRFVAVFRFAVSFLAFYTFVVTIPLGIPQTSKGAVAGSVTDPTGAAVPNASVVLTQKETSAQRETATNGAGIYRFEGVNLGTYNLLIKAQGFRDARVNDLSVEANQVASFDVRLELGSAAETVTVEAGAIALQTSEAVRGGNFESQQVTQLPLPAQDSINVLLLVPGVQNASTPHFTHGSNNHSVHSPPPRPTNSIF